jgi:hypothetical protein
MRLPDRVDGFGLSRREILDEATSVASDLFAVLAVCAETSLDYPMEEEADLVSSLENLDTGVLFPDGTVVEVADALEHLPAEFLPVVSQADLVRKLYMALVISRQRAASEAWGEIEEGRYEMTAGHPLPSRVV